MNSMNNVFLQTGGNLGNRLQNLEIANQKIEYSIGKITQYSSIYETEAWGITDQPSFLNQVLHVQTALSPNELMGKIHTIEKEMGRIRTIKMGPRSIDIDILFFNNAIVKQPLITIPHPFIEKRRFVLVPLNEIAPVFMHPVLEKSIAALLAECMDLSAVKCFSGKPDDLN